MTSRRILAVLAFASLAAFGCTNTQSTNANTVSSNTSYAASTGKVKDAKDGKAQELALLREKLGKHRAQQIERLSAYASAGKFPINTTSAAPLHELKDARGTYCAVANLAVEDGLQDVIDAESKSHNNLLFGDLKDGVLYSWILSSGLTQEEIAEIQAPAPYVGEMNGPIPVQPIGAPPPQVVASKEEQAKVALQKHFVEVEAKIIANSESSLDLAANRLEGTFGTVALSML